MFCHGIGQNNTRHWEPKQLSMTIKQSEESFLHPFSSRATYFQKNLV